MNYIGPQSVTMNGVKTSDAQARNVVCKYNDVFKGLRVFKPHADIHVDKNVTFSNDPTTISHTQSKRRDRAYIMDWCNSAPREKDSMGNFFFHCRK